MGIPVPVKRHLDIKTAPTGWYWSCGYVPHTCRIISWHTRGLAVFCFVVLDIVWNWLVANQTKTWTLCTLLGMIPWAPSQYPKRRLSVRSRKVSKPRDLYLELSDRSEIWQALRQQCCRCACQISKRNDKLKYQSRGFETLRDLTIKTSFRILRRGPGL